VDFKIALNSDGTAHRLDRAREFGDHAVAGATKNPAIMAHDQTIYDHSVCA
jgi:hypothetical protein